MKGIPAAWGGHLRGRTGPLSLSRRIVASVALGLTLILGLFGLVALWTIRDSTEVAYRERVTLAQTLARRVDDVLGYALVMLEREAAILRIEPGRPLADDQRQRLADLRLRVGSFSIVSVTDASGITVWTEPSQDDVAIGSPLAHPSVQLVLRKGERQITELPSRIDGKTVFACLAVPLRDSRGRLTGALMAEVDPSHPALTLLPSGEVGEGIQAQLMNTDGRLLAGTTEISPGVVAQHAVLLAELMNTRTSGHRLHEPPPTAPVPPHVVAFAPVSLLPSWGVAVEQPVDAVLAMPRQLQQRLALFGLAALLLAAAVAWFDVRRVVRPLKDLTAAAERFAAGQLDRPVSLEVARTDELGILAQAFETMRQRLGASLAEVAEWNRSALLDPDRVAALVAGRARDLLGTEVAGLSLVEEGCGDLTWRLLVGGSDRFRQIRLRPGEGVAGYVVKTGRPLVMNDWEHCPAAGPVSAPILTLEGLRAALAVPLQSGGRTFGVLMVASHRPTAFTTDQVALLSSLANQAAVALENARLYQKVQSLAVLEERERIAREMHDGLGQVLGYVNTKTLAVARLLEVGKIDEARLQVAQLEAAAKEVYADIREAILGLRTTLGPEHDFLTALRGYLEGFEQQSGIAVELQVLADESALRLPFGAEIQLLRIVQEALANVRKHARASRATVRLATVDGTVRLVVEDDGQGFDPTRLTPEGWPRFGLQTMRERAEAIGGTFLVESRAATGALVTITVPQDHEEKISDAADARPTRR
ncbi:MAG: GAF domain-containing protein [Armatimonadetes bacterium]|nr:GAF domain-containing protein [Armatimonadota bacterium]